MTYILSTVLCTILAALAGVFALIGARCMKRAEIAEQSLAREFRKLAALRDDLSILEARLQKLTGRVYATQRRDRLDRLPEPGADPALDLSVDTDGVDADLDAQLRLQLAPAVAPGTKR